MRFANASVRYERAAIAAPDDALALIQEYYQAIGVLHRDDPATLINALARTDQAIWVVYRSDEPAGCVMYRPLPDLPAAGEVKRMYVRAAYRGIGIATGLMDVVEQFARDRGDEWLYLDSKDDLHSALRLYLRLGYTPCERYNNNSQATIFMRKNLGV